jgi:hypothetical protein
LNKILARYNTYFHCFLRRDLYLLEESLRRLDKN